MLSRLWLGCMGIAMPATEIRGGAWLVGAWGKRICMSVESYGLFEL